MQDLERYTSIGLSLPRVDAVEKVTGETKYIADICFPKMLFGKILRSSFPHAKIVHIDIEKAKRLPGVKAIVTAEDVPADRRYGHLIFDQTIYARSKVRYVGEPVAAVAAIDEDLAEEALDLIEVEYAELPAVFDPEEAMKPGAPLIHEEWEQYETLLPGVIRYGNVCCHLKFHRGDVTKAFKDADYIFEDKFQTTWQYQAYLETRGAVATVSFGGKITVWANTQTPFINRGQLAKVLNLPLNKISYTAPYVGGAYGGKANLYADAHCVVLALKSGCPVKIINSREEDIVDSRPRHPATIEVKTGVNSDGRIIGRQFRMIYDTGAYTEEGPGNCNMGLMFGVGPYNIPNLKIDSLCVYTNSRVCSAYRGYGVPQPNFASESQLDIIAKKLNIDPLELRVKNALSEGDPHPVLGVKLEGIGYRETLLQAAEKANWQAPRERKNRGKGLSSVIFMSGGFIASAQARMNEDGTVVLHAGSVEIGSGGHTALVQIVAEELGISLEDITLVAADTGNTPFYIGTFGDSTVHDVGVAVLAATKDLKHQILECAAEMLEANIKDLETANGKIVVVGTPQKSISLREVALCRHFFKEGPLLGKSGFNRNVPPPPEVMLFNIPIEGRVYPWSYQSYTFSSHIAEVEVDEETGKVKVLKYVAAHDCGQPINPKNVEGQQQGGIMQGLGMALTEEIFSEKGWVLNPNLLDYKIPVAVDSPEIQPIIVKAYAPMGPFGAKGVGNPPLVAAPPAIANAIYDAVGVRIKDLPITPEKVLRALEERDKDKEREKGGGR